MGGPGAKILYAQGAGEDLDGGLGEGGRMGAMEEGVWSWVCTILFGRQEGQPE